MQMELPSTTAAATNVHDFLSELDGGQLAHKLSIALSTVAAAAVDNEKQGKVSLEFTFDRITGTAQVHCAHTLKFVRPTLDGKSGEEEKRTTPLFVGKFGKLTIAPENQLDMFVKKDPSKAI